MPIVIAGNKSDEDDVERVVPRELVEKTVKRWRCGYIECSAKGNNNIVDVFEKVLIQSNLQYFDLSEAVCRRRRSFPVYSGNSKLNHVNANACTVS